MNKLHWGVDWLVVRDCTFYGYGWVFHEERNIRDLKLKVQFGEGESQTITASIGKPRDDTAASFPKFPSAKYSGFTLYGSSGQKQNAFSELFLRATLEDDSVSELPIPRDRISNFGKSDKAGGRISRQQLVAYLKRGMFLLKKLQITNLLGNLKRYLGSRTASFLESPEWLRSKLDTNELRHIVLVIDHGSGGGANQYQERMSAEKIDEGATVVIFSFNIATLTYVLMVRSKLRNERFAIPGYDFLLGLAKLIDIKEVIYNTGVTFIHPEKVPILIAELKSRYHPRLTLLVHDFFMVCPSHYLLDDMGEYCGIPDIGRCQTCLVKNQQDYSSLFQSRDIVQWRALWGNVVELADEVRTFSNDSLGLLQKAYPSLDLARAVVKPHTIEYLEHRTIQPTHTAGLRIGVVGRIGYHKGAKVVQELADEIKARKLDIQIVVIGFIEAQCDQSVVRQTGSYKHENLSTLIESSGVNIMLFPSIWPETFSYVVQELIELNLPVACFDLGAPAERLSNYAKGLILEDTAASATVNNLIAFHQRIYLTK